MGFQLHLLQATLFFGFLGDLDLFNNWYYSIFSNNRRGFYFKIRVGKGTLLPKIIGNKTGKISIYQYIKTAEKMTIRRMFFPLRRKIEFTVEGEA